MTARTDSMEQLSLLARDDSVPHKRRVFFCLHPDEAAAARIEQLIPRLQAAHGLQGNPIARERLHVTVDFLGDYKVLPPYLLSAAGKAVAGVCSSAFDIRFDRVVSFRGRPRHHPLVLLASDGAAEVVALHQVIEAALLQVGVRSRQEPPLAHVTLSYTAGRIAELPVEPIMWRVQQFSLIESLVGRSRHIVHGTWALH